MKTSEKGINLIKNFEGLRLKAYLCPAGVLTIGYGHTGGVKPNQFITKLGAELLLETDLLFPEKAVNELVKIKLTQNQFDALVSFTFNVGTNAFKKSTLLKIINTGTFKLKDVEIQLMRWVRDGQGRILQGLVNRRKKEFKLFEGVENV
ncbi:MAG TPA: muraminidase [Flavobacterium sp.]|nr:muraminidase [Flavobacterium sp.]